MDTWTHTPVTQLDTIGEPTCIGYAGIIITGGCCMGETGWTLMTLMMVGFSLRCRNSRCSWHQPHQTQKQDTAMSRQREPFEEDCKTKKMCQVPYRNSFVNLNIKSFAQQFFFLHACMHHTLILCLCRIEDLSDKSAGEAMSRGIPKAEVIAGLNMSHNGRHVFSPNLDETVQARHGQHQNP